METVGTLTGYEWNNCFSDSSTEETDIMAQLLRNFFSCEQDGSSSDMDIIQSAFWPIPDDPTIVEYCNESLFYSSDTGNSNINCFSQAMEIPLVMSTFSEYQIHEGVYTSGDMENVEIPQLQAKRKRHSELHVPAQDDTNFQENPKKKTRISASVQGSKKNAQSKKNQMLSSVSKDAETTACTKNGQSCSSYSSEDDSNASNVSQELSCSENSNLKGKTRASRGSATDPQSLYARKRRERINERLRILQNLVPNGTKVDISTMLEEAVDYVKFLQLQIKLLSSDDLWMYSPIAYNGMDIGLDMKISFPR